MTITQFKKELNQKILPKYYVITHILNFDDNTYEIQVRSVSTGETQVIFDVWDHFQMASKFRVVGDISFTDLRNITTILDNLLREIEERGE